MTPNTRRVLANPFPSKIYTTNNAPNIRYSPCSIKSNTPDLRITIRKPSNRIRIHTQIIPPTRLIAPVNRNHLFRTHLVQRKPLHTRLPLNTKDLILAAPKPVRRIRVTAADIVILEERIQPPAVDHYVLGIQDTQTKGVADGVWRARGGVVRVGVGV
jgi:hypothetical protein